MKRLLKDMAHHLLLRLYGVDEEEIKKEVEEQHRRILARRVAREKAGVRINIRVEGLPEADDFEDWLNLRRQQDN